ncbi:hypothetical protein XAC908_350007 [Xanthomonas citri pv. citri]|nr:hypothetical protein XAC908_350007 [Xanthomonas citri pv. citri]
MTDLTSLADCRSVEPVDATHGLPQTLANADVATRMPKRKKPRRSEVFTIYRESWCPGEDSNLHEVAPAST